MMHDVGEGAGKTNPMNERAMTIFEFGEKEHAGEERKRKKKGKELLERCDKRWKRVLARCLRLVSISDKPVMFVFMFKCHVMPPTTTCYSNEIRGKKKTKGYITLVSSLHKSSRYQI